MPAAHKIVDALLEGDAQPGYDVPVGYLVIFHFRGEEVKIRVEASRPGLKKWAAARAVASHLKKLEVKPDEATVGSVLRGGSVVVKNIPDTLGKKDYIPRWKRKQGR